eukprot:6547126-Lingulodinium_polyedra.AAC.1
MTWPQSGGRACPSADARPASASLPAMAEASVPEPAKKAAEDAGKRPGVLQRAPGRVQLTGP